MREIGRLREQTFRASGEGTGKARDLDRFDAYYTHLVLWNQERREIAGAYRICNVQHVLHRYGMRGLYTATLFRFQPKFFAKVGPALELGRSFVHLDYQRQYAPLLVLWKGIGSYLVRHPETPILFGAVSISADYSPASRQVPATRSGLRIISSISWLSPPTEKARPAPVTMATRSVSRKPQGSMMSTPIAKHAARRRMAPAFCGISGS